MPKPIVLVGLPNGTQKEVQETLKNLGEKMGQDYYIIVYSKSGNDLEFKVFYEKDFEEVKYEELKKIVEESIKK